jgi:hypothetical protein
MRRCLAFLGVLYSGVGSFVFLVMVMRGSDSAYTSNQNWYEAFEVALAWPWHFLQGIGIGA